LRDFLVALSLANLLFLRAWNKVLFGGYFDDFKPDDLIVAILVLIAAVGLWTGWRLIRSARPLAILGKILFLLTLTIPINAMRLYYDQDFVAVYTRRYQWVAWLLAAMLAAPVLFAALTKRLRLTFLVRYGIFMVLALAPFTLFTFGSVVSNLSRRSSHNEEQDTSAARPPNFASTWESRNGSRIQPEKRRVVWIIFDELEERTAFTDRPASVSMPELDRFRSESFVATAATPPGGSTLVSVPALLNGRAIARVELPHDHLRIWHQGETGPVAWDPGMTVFAETSAAAIKTGLVGVFFPYCATHGRVLTRCNDFRTESSHDPPAKKVRRALVAALDAVPLAFRLFFHSLILENEIDRYQSTIQNSGALAADPGLDLVYLHFPLPHPPGIYDRVTGRLDASKTHSYLDNLALTDVSFGVLRRTMEHAGLWERSVVIVTADHWWRTNEMWKTEPEWTAEEQQAVAGRGKDPRVPFIVKLPGNGNPMLYQRPFNTLVTRRMVMAFLNGQLGTSNDLATWLDSHATDPILGR